MKFLLILLFIFSSQLFATENSESFLVTVYDQKIHVVSPAKRKDIVSIIIKNETFDDIRSEVVGILKNSHRSILKRFVLKAQKSNSLQVRYKNLKALYYISIAPPFQKVELKFSKRPYEIPEKK